MFLGEIKKLLPNLLEKNGIPLIRDGKSWKSTCLVHSDSNPSVQINMNGRAFCYGCGAVYDIFDAVGYIEGIGNFKEQLSRICSIFNITVTNSKNYSSYKRESKPVFRGRGLIKDHRFVSLNIESARLAYNLKRAREILSYSKISGRIESQYPFLSENGNVMCADFRIIEDSGKKKVITFWFDGQSLKISDPPNLIWGLDHKDTNKPCLIVEGSKCGKIAHEKLGHYFSVHTWNRGCEGAKYCDWSKVLGFENYYLFYDYDQKRDQYNEILPIKQQPGYKAMFQISDLILELNNNENTNCYLIPPSEDAINLKNDGADIEEQLQVFTPDECIDYIIGKVGNNNSENFNNVLEFTE